MALLSFQLYAPLRAIVTLLQSDLEPNALFDLIPSEACRHLGYDRALLYVLEGERLVHVGGASTDPGLEMDTLTGVFPDLYETTLFEWLKRPEVAGRDGQENLIRHVDERGEVTWAVKLAANHEALGLLLVSRRSELPEPPGLLRLASSSDSFPPYASLKKESMDGFPAAEQAVSEPGFTPGGRAKQGTGGHPVLHSSIEAELLALYAIVGSSALKNARLHEESRRKVEELASLYQTGQAVVSTLELEPLLQGITDTARDLLKAKMCGLLVLGEGPERYEYFKVSGWALKPDRLPKTGGIFSIPYKEGVCVRVDDIAKHPRSAGTALGHPPIKAFLGVPLRVKDRILGTLFVGKGMDDDTFSDANEELLLAFANQVAISIENARLYERQKEAAIRLQELNQELSEAQKSRLLTEERNRIAQELHDRVAQALFTIGLKADWCLAHLPQTGEARAALETIKALAGQSTGQIRDAIYTLSFADGEEGRLVTDLRDLVWEFSQDGEAGADLVVSGKIRRVPSKVEHGLLKVAQEALTNVRKHSQATGVVISLRFSPIEVAMVVQDDGVGISRLVMETYWGSAAHFGLKIMRKQIESVGGRFQLANGDEGGLILSATIPLEALSE